MRLHYCCVDLTRLIHTFHLRLLDSYESTFVSYLFMLYCFNNYLIVNIHLTSELSTGEPVERNRASKSHWWCKYIVACIFFEDYVPSPPPRTTYEHNIRHKIVGNPSYLRYGVLSYIKIAMAMLYVTFSSVWWLFLLLARMFCLLFIIRGGVGL